MTQSIQTLPSRSSWHRVKVVVGAAAASSRIPEACSSPLDGGYESFRFMSTCGCGSGCSLGRRTAQGSCGAFWRRGCGLRRLAALRTSTATPRRAAAARACALCPVGNRHQLGGTTGCHGSQGLFRKGRRCAAGGACSHWRLNHSLCVSVSLGAQGGKWDRRTR